jgi:superfamily II DNA helicase RecQ
MAEATLILERMYRAGACYRTQRQQQAIEHILASHGQVVAILRTSKGKSLLYLLPCQLPGAGTTIVILPLLVLRDEMRY